MLMSSRIFRRGSPVPRIAVCLGFLGIGALVPSPSPAVEVRGNQVILSAHTWLIPWKGVDRTMQLTFDLFKQRHPEVRIVEHEFMFLPGAYSGAGQVMSLVGRAGPDLFDLFHSDLNMYAREGVIQPIEDLIDSWEGKARFPPSVLEGLKIDGHSWLVPAREQYYFMMGEPGVFAAGSLTSRSVPRDWEELGRFAGRLSSVERPPIVIQSSRVLGEIWIGLVMDSGDRTTVRLTDKGVEVDLASPAGIAAAEKLAAFGKALRETTSNPIKVTAWNAFHPYISSGKFVFALGTQNDLEQYGAGAGKFPVIAALPGMTPGRTLSLVSYGFGYAIPAYVREPEHRKLIWEFYTTATEISPIYQEMVLAESMASGGTGNPYLIYCNSNHPAMKKMPRYWVDLMMDFQSHANVLPPDRLVGELTAILGPPLLEFMEKGGDAGRMLRGVEDQFNEKVHLKSRRSSAGWRFLAIGVLVVFGAALLTGLVLLVRTLRREYRLLRSAAIQKMTPAKWSFALALFLPATAVFLVFGAMPLLIGLKTSLFEHVLRGGGSFVGAENFINAAIDPQTHLALGRTFYYLGLSFLLGFVAPMVVALMIAGLPRFQFLVRSALFLPAIAGAVMVSVIWWQLFAGGGYFNLLVRLLGFAPRDWLGDSSTAMFAVVLAQSWSVLGISGLIYVSGLSSIPVSLYEDALMAGAGFWGRLMNVTLPYIKPLIGISFVGWLINTLRTAEMVLLFTGGGPKQATYVIGLDIFYQAYVHVRFGFAMAEVWLLVAAILILSIYQMRAVRMGHMRVMGY